MSRCGSVDGAFGPVRNPWKYKFHEVSQLVEPSRSTLTAAAVGEGARITSRRHCSNSAAVCGNKTANEPSDWYIAGGSSGGSAVAVAAGVVFAYVIIVRLKYISLLSSLLISCLQHNLH
jgi:aspartyl-tRNA(Asn)/glutamyl-tRNA(Gln) amidotransferase subunit A